MPSPETGAPLPCGISDAYSFETVMVKHGDLAAFDVKIVTLQVGILSTGSPQSLTVFTRRGNLCNGTGSPVSALSGSS
jgi:hypothetical protein